MLKKNVLLFCVIILLATCKKYPDGPLLSLYTKEHRVLGIWDVEYFEVNGYDSTSFLKGQPFYGKYRFEKNRDRSLFRYEANDQQYNLGGYWSFQNHKEEICITFEAYTALGNIGPYRAAGIIWKIRRLKEKELWLETSYAGKNYFLKFSQ